LINKSGWGIEEKLDPSHAMKSFERIVNKYPVLNEIAESMRKFMKRLLHWSHVSVEQKQSAWVNVFLHCCGNDEFCPFEYKDKGYWIPMEREEVRRALHSFLEDTKSILAKCNSEFSTQTNEPFHRLKLKYATKDVKWNSTWEARMAWNFLYKSLELPRLPPEQGS
jgi:hypothetical protein